MTNYMIMHGDVPEHYFFRPYEGICMRKQNPLGVWQKHTNVFEEGKDGFGVYYGEDGFVHLIAVDSENKLIYAVSDGNLWKQYVISKLNNEISILDIKLYSIRGRLNLIYSALYNGEILLVHSILGDGAKPSTIDIMKSKDFFVSNEKVYYTNSENILGFMSLSDEKPSNFTALFDNAQLVNVCSANGTDRILFTIESRLFLDGNELLYDSRMENPIMSVCKDKFYILWKSNGFVRYIKSIDGKNFSEPMRFMNTGAEMSVFSVQKGKNFAEYYGYQSVKGVVFLGNPDVFEVTLTAQKPQDSELERIKALLSETRQDMQETKKELSKLGRLIGSLSEKG